MKVLGMSLVAVIAAIAFAASGSAAHTKTVTVVMRDPGCHWFSADGNFLTKLSVRGPVTLRNIDEAALKVAGPQGVKLEPVGSLLALSHGTYHISMVGQAADDNHLTLVVK